MKSKDGIKKVVVIITGLLIVVALALVIEAYNLPLAISFPLVFLIGILTRKVWENWK